MEVAALERVFAELTRELRLLVDRSGSIVWVDARAAAVGFAVGQPIDQHAVAGTEDKIRELVRRAATDRVSGWELAVVLDGRPGTLVVHAGPIDDHIAILGSLAAEDYAGAIHEASRSMHEIVELHRELARQKARLEESYRAVRTLHEELAQQADRLRTSVEIKSRVVAAVSHEFRTPLHSILGLSRLLLADSDGPLGEEQRMQIQLIRGSAEELSAMITDMLDLARLDAGNAPVRAQTFELSEFMSAMRGAMLPMVPADAKFDLVFDPAPDVPLETDRAKLSQIVRNLIANALKFTRQGEVRVTAVIEGAHGEDVRISVRDTGIGIAPEDREKIFEEFVQIESELQRAALGTGLGLPLAKKLAQLLGGRIELASEPGEGSTFSVIVPLEHAEVAQYRRIEQAANVADPTRAPVLVVEDDRSAVYVYERYLSMAGFQVLPARTTAAARELLRDVRPSAILLDIMLEGEDTWSFLAELKRDPATHDIPVLVCTVMNRESQARALGADEFWLKPVDEDKLIRKLHSIASGRGAKVLVVDDDPTARYLVKKFLTGTPYELIEAADGKRGVELARSEQPDVIMLDFLLEEHTAFDVLDDLKADPRTRLIPVIIITSHALPLEERERLAANTEAILSKEHLSRELAINRIRDALGRAGVREHAPLRLRRS
ncbi:MAG TPA: response regulator [Kofleriaceae bacterium]|nr:response regulator [Kofleriaceae bacterium]